jgi:hypothetical protein
VVRFSAWPLFCFWQLSSSVSPSSLSSSSSSSAAFTGSVVAFAAVAAGAKGGEHILSFYIPAT